ncbi:MFS transporter [Candidatus Bathyarchaeota archaeon]|nr:MFS transporter [Candidatus Bathyarchaeota archaeon]
MTWLYNFCFSATCGPLSWIIPAEIFDLKTRAKVSILSSVTPPNCSVLTQPGCVYRDDDELRFQHHDRADHVRGTRRRDGYRLEVVHPLHRKSWSHHGYRPALTNTL